MKKAPPRRGLYCPALQPAVTLLRPSSPAAGSGCAAAVPAAVAAAGRVRAPPADHAGSAGNSDCAAGPSRISGSRGRDAAVEAILCRAGLNPCGDLHTNPSRLHCSAKTALFFRAFARAAMLIPGWNRLMSTSEDGAVISMNMGRCAATVTGVLRSLKNVIGSLYSDTETTAPALWHYVNYVAVFRPGSASFRML